IRRHAVCRTQCKSGRQRRSGRTAKKPARGNHHSEIRFTAAIVNFTWVVGGGAFKNARQRPGPSYLPIRLPNVPLAVEHCCLKPSLSFRPRGLGPATGRYCLQSAWQTRNGLVRLVGPERSISVLAATVCKAIKRPA